MDNEISCCYLYGKPKVLHRLSGWSSFSDFFFIFVPVKLVHISFPKWIRMVSVEKARHYVSYTDYYGWKQLRGLILRLNMFSIGNKLTALIGEACNEYCEVGVRTYILLILPAVLVVTFISSTVCTAFVVHVCWCWNSPISIHCNSVRLILFFLLQFTFLVWPTTGTVAKFFSWKQYKLHRTALLMFIFVFLKHLFLV